MDIEIEIEDDWLIRERMLIGSEAAEKIKARKAAVFGLGGVGGTAVEGLVRAGIGAIAVIDHDVIKSSNLNRQIITDTSNIGMLKTEAALRRIKKINPAAEVKTLNEFISAENAEEIFNKIDADYIIDAIDMVTSKLCIIKLALERGINIISCMGTGNKLDAARFKISDIYKTSVCPLAKVMRGKLKELDVKALDVLWSDEEPVKTGSRTPASASYMPPIAGYMLAGWVIRKIIEK